jgi:hypothetical protein
MTNAAHGMANVTYATGNSGIMQTTKITREVLRKRDDDRPSISVYLIRAIPARVAINEYALNLTVSNTLAVSNDG